MIRLISVWIFLLSITSTQGQPLNKLTNAEKIFGLSKFWQEVNYNFVYLYKVDRKKWDSAYVRLIDQVQHAENDYEYYRLLKRFCSMLKDGHTNIDFPEYVQSKLMKTMFGEYRIYFENIQHKAIVTHINRSKKKLFRPVVNWWK